MEAVAAKRREVVLSEPVREFYSQCRDILNKILPKLIYAPDLLKISEMFKPDPQSMLNLFTGDNGRLERERLEVKIYAVGMELNRIFANKNALPSRNLDNEDMLKLLSDYAEENFKKRLDISTVKTGYAGATGTNSIHFEEGLPILDAVHLIAHENKHLGEPFAKKKKELNAMVSPLFKDPSKAVEFFSKLTGANADEIADEINAQDNAYSYTDTTVFLIRLYDKGLWKKPMDEKTKESLEFSKFLLDPELRRASMRYTEGRAEVAVADSLSSNDSVLGAYSAMWLAFYITSPSPQVSFDDHKPVALEQGENLRISVFHSKAHYRAEANRARKIEGLRHYITLCCKLADNDSDGIFERIKNGEEKLKKVEEECGKRDVVPGIDMDGNLVVIKERKMFMADMDKLKAGITDIDELVIKEPAPRLPEKLS